jgi:hypothetical protein
MNRTICIFSKETLFVKFLFSSILFLFNYALGMDLVSLVFLPSTILLLSPAFLTCYQYYLVHVVTILESY